VERRDKAPASLALRRVQHLACGFCMMCRDLSSAQPWSGKDHSPWCEDVVRFGGNSPEGECRAAQELRRGLLRVNGYAVRTGLHRCVPTAEIAVMGPGWGGEHHSSPTLEAVPERQRPARALELAEEIRPQHRTHCGSWSRVVDDVIDPARRVSRSLVVLS